MLYTPLTKQAMKLCFEAHAGQVDKCGIPYVNHPLHLAEQMRSEDEVCVALLHDVMEDCGKTPDDLRAIGISERVIETLLLLTHDGATPYLDYVGNLKDDEIARKVKVADLRHNSELSRLDTVFEKDLQRLRKYMDARVALGDMAYELETPVGPFAIEVNGKPYPFTVKRVTGEPFTFFESAESDGENGSASARMAGHPDETFLLEADVLPLAQGDRLAARYDFGSAVSNWGSGERVCYKVYDKDGYSIGLGVYDDESFQAPGSHAFRLRDDGGVYDIVDSPAGHRYCRRAHTVSFRLAWRKGTSDVDTAIVGWVAGW